MNPDKMDKKSNDVPVGQKIPADGKPIVTQPVTEQPTKHFFKPLIMLAVLIILAVSGGAVYYITSAKSPKSGKMTDIVGTPTLTPVPIFLTLNSPIDGDSALNGEILVSGKTLPGATIAIYTANDEVLVDVNEEGAFEETIILEPGASTLTVTAFDTNGEEKSVSVDINQT